MAELLSNQEMFFTQWEPKVQNRFILYVDGIPSFLLKKCDRPAFTAERKEIDYINQKRFYRGKQVWNEITMELYDPIVPSGAQAVMEWARLAFEAISGRAGYHDVYSKDLTIDVLGPPGDRIEEWTIKSAFPTNVEFGNLDYTNGGDALPITLHLAYDYGILQY